MGVTAEAAAARCIDRRITPPLPLPIEGRGNRELEIETMKDLGGLMKQAQAMQQKLQDAQARLAESTVEGTSGGGMVTVVLKGTGELAKVTLDESLIEPGEGEVIADLIVAAHADAKKKLDAKQAQMMQDAAGPMAGLMGGIPGMKF